MKFTGSLKKFVFNNYTFIISGILIGVASLVLGHLGNPGNMGFCIACFLRDTAGSLGLQSKIQYARPEIIGIVLGAFIMALFRKDFSAKGGSSPLTRFVLGFAVVTGALTFLGCPLRMILRLGAGDMNAFIGLLGFIAGIIVGIIFLNKRFSLNRTYQMPRLEGFIAPASSLVMLILLVISASGVTGLLVFSKTGPGSLHAPIYASLIAGLIVGAIGQRFRVCFISGTRDAIMFKQFQMLYLFLSVLVTVIIGNLAMGNFKFGFDGQQIAHTDHIWNFLGLFAVGIGSVFLGGCPLRQLVLAGSGNSDSAMAVLGMIVGAAVLHNLDAVASAAGVTTNGMIACSIAIVVILAIGFFNRKKIA